jgi:hypothetical protein
LDKIPEAWLFFGAGQGAKGQQASGILSSKTYDPKGQAIVLQSRKAARPKKEQKGKKGVGESGPVLGARF